MTGTPTAYVDLVDYLVAQGYVRSKRLAREAIVGGKVSVNGNTYAYQHTPRHLLDMDECGRWRIMLEGTPDPRPCTPSRPLGGRR